MKRAARMMRLRLPVHVLLLLLLLVLLVIVTTTTTVSAFFLNEPEVRWALGTGRPVLRGNNVQVTRQGQHVFATAADGGLLILSPVDQQPDDAETTYEPSLQVFEPPRSESEATLYCDTGVVLVDETVTRSSKGDGGEGGDGGGEGGDDDESTALAARQFAVYGVTEEYIGTSRSFVLAVNVGGNLLDTSSALDGVIRGTPVVLGRYLYVVHNVNDAFGRVSVLSLDERLALVETVI